MLKKTFMAASLALLLAACATEKEPVVNYKLWLDWPERRLPDFLSVQTEGTDSGKHRGEEGGVAGTHVSCG